MVAEAQISIAPPKSLAVAREKVADGRNGNTNCIIGGGEYLLINF